MIAWQLVYHMKVLKTSTYYQMEMRMNGVVYFKDHMIHGPTSDTINLHSWAGGGLIVYATHYKK